MVTKQPAEAQEQWEREWREEAQSSFLSGSVSARHAQRLVIKAQRAGAKGAEDLAKTGKSGVCKKNISRDMKRSMRKNSHWPRLYYAKIPLWDPKKDCKVFKDHPFLLPHEWLAKAQSTCELAAVMANAADDVDIVRHMSKVAEGLGSPWTDYVPLGFHCDGVPFGSQIFYSDSLELFSLNFPCGTVGMKIPFTSVQKNHLIKHETYQSILQVLAWSLKHLAFGTMPDQRQDGTAFGPGEQWRVRWVRKLKPAKALLVEIRADWAALKQVFQFPQQNENSGICWMCSATPQDIRLCSSTAAWRLCRRTAMSFHMHLKQTGKSCALWSVPGCSSEIVMVDWLHCADLGVSADVLGNVLLELVESMPGQDRNVRMSALWKEISDEYTAQGLAAEKRFPTLRLNSFLVAGKSPKLKGKAAHVRYIVPVVDRVVQKLLQPSDAHLKTVMSCVRHLAECYQSIETFDAAQLDLSARKMALLYCALEKEQLAAGTQKVWKVKPKLHLFLELCGFLCLERQRGNPRKFWTYGDETHGGLMRTIAKSRGGPNSSNASAYRLLTLWSSSTDMFAMLEA
jgi:hypothetical protein